MVERKVLELHSRVNVSDSVAIEVRAPVPIDYGLDVRAEAFGDQVFLATRLLADGTLEAQCPLSGQWTGFGYTGSAFLLKSDRPNAHQSWLPAQPMLSSPEPRWTMIDVQRILDKQRERYYLPRKWNVNTDGWIGHQQLTELLESYQKEKRDVSGTETGGGDDSPGAASGPGG